MSVVVAVRTARIRPVDPGRLPAPQRAAWSAVADSERDRYATGVLLQLAAYAEAGEYVGALRRWCPGCGSGEHGKAVPDSAAAGRWSGSVSHSGGWAAFALVARQGDREVGIDIERETAWSDGMADLILAPGEADPGDAAGRARLWVRKEAALKACGAGLLSPMTGIDVAGDLVRSVGAPPATGRPIAVADLVAPPGYAAAVAVVGASKLRIDHAEMPL